ncbi:hypothetical protein D3C85_293130 [compost metagenome]
MKTVHERYEALLKIQAELQNWSAYQPTWHFKLHSSKEINLALQDIKKLIAFTAQELLVEEAQKLNMYFDSPEPIDSGNLS